MLCNWGELKVLVGTNGKGPKFLTELFNCSVLLLRLLIIKEPLSLMNLKGFIELKKLRSKNYHEIQIIKLKIKRPFAKEILHLNKKALLDSKISFEKRFFFHSKQHLNINRLTWAELLSGVKF